MAQGKADQTKANKAATEKTAADELLSKFLDLDRDLDVEELDQFLVQQDPKFNHVLTTISQDTDLKAVEVEADDDSQSLFEETEKWNKSGGFWRILYKVYPNAPKKNILLKKWIFKTKKSARANWILFKDWTHDSFVKARLRSIDYIKNKREELSNSARQNRLSYRKWSTKLKLLWYFTFFGLVVIGALIYGVLSGKIAPPGDDLFIVSFQKHASSEQSYTEDDQFEKFYDNVRSAPNLFLIQKIVVNIKRSKSSGDNPMAALDFFIETFSEESLLEIQSRESMVRDLCQRTVEDFSFDELESQNGKQKLSQILMREISRVLKTGGVKAIRLKTFILKP